MAEVTGKIVDMAIDLSGKARLTLEINEKNTAMSLYDELHLAEKLDIKVTKHRQKRSLDANAYAWVLMDKLADKLSISKVDIYRENIRKIGGVSTIVCVIDKAVDDLCRGWQSNGLGWQTETVPSKLDGCTNVILYYGSSTFDKAQMQRLLALIKQDCDAVGIDTKTPDEIAEMVALWGA